MEPIIIKAPPSKKRRGDIVRLQADASDIIYRYEEKTNYPAAYIVSEIIRQAAPMVQFKGAKE